MQKIDIGKIFESVNQSPELKKYMFIGAFIHLILVVLAFIPPEVNLSGFIILGVSLLVDAFLFGFFIDNIQKNATLENAEKFEFVDMNIFKRIWSGIKFSLCFLLPTIIVSLFYAIIFGVLILLIIGLIHLIDSSVSGYWGVMIIFLNILLAIFATMLTLILLYPQIVANYINRKSIWTICNFANVFKMYKKYFGSSFTVSALTLVFSILFYIPILGFYFDIIWANMYAKYALLVKENND